MKRVGFGVLVCLCLGLPVAGAASASGKPPVPSGIGWASPTPPDGTRYNLTIGQPLTIGVAAADAVPTSVIHITPNAVPAGATVTTTDGNPASATVVWTPTTAGDYAVQFNARSSDAVPLTAQTRTFLIHVAAPPPPPPPPPPPKPAHFVLTDGNVSHWSMVLVRATVRSAPSPWARVVTRLGTLTGDGTQNIVSLLEGVRRNGQIWIHVRLPILPNNTTGWVLRGTLGSFNEVHTHVYVNTGTTTLTLMRDGKLIFQTKVGVGRPYWPTPKGEFYIRDELLGFGDPFYGPIAFGTSARSAVLTDWPGGGYVGIHGTNEPGLIPGHISHGCIRLRNATILKLAALMPVGTPLTIV